MDVSLGGHSARISGIALAINVCLKASRFRDTHYLEANRNQLAVDHDSAIVVVVADDCSKQGILGNERHCTSLDKSSIPFSAVWLFFNFR